jgi:ribosome maturation factor RimP
MSTADGVRSLTQTALEGSDVTLVDVSVTRAGRRSVVRVVLDRPAERDDDGVSRTPTPPLTLDEIAEVSRAVGRAFDASDVLGETAYTLEVTSPGVDRPLEAPHGFRRNIGRLVRVSLADGGTLTGRLSQADDEQVTLTGEPERRLPYADISRAVVQIEFAPAQTEGE